MKVSSPIGDFPFETRSIRFQSDGIVIEGAMGAWPATIRLAAADVPQLVRALPMTVTVAGVGLLITTLFWTLRRRP